MRQLVGITLDNLSDLPAGCRGCAFWELSPAARDAARRAGTEAQDKQAWVSNTLLEWGGCGHLAYVDGQVAGYVLYAPPAYVPRSTSFPTSPAAADALLLMTARVLPPFAGHGLGRVLIQTAARDAVRHGVRALEAFGRHGGQDAAGDDPGADVSTGCLLPAAHLLAVGFRTVRAHPRTPRLRLDIRSTVTWREDVEYAIERLFGVPSPALVR